MITIEVDDQQVRQAFTRLVASAKSPRPVLEQIGELLMDSTKQRFATSTAPDGSRWAENSDITLLRHLNKFKGSRRKDGGLTQKGAARLGNKKPLIGETGMLSSQIFLKVEGAGVLLVGSTMEYAAMQQFGGQKSKFPNLWGDIPARPFLGISDQDQNMILDQISDFLNQSFRL